MVKGMVNRLFKHKRVQKRFIALLGPEKAGKTTLATYLEHRESITQEIESTIGIEIRKSGKVIDDKLIKIIDTGGQKTFQIHFWEVVVQHSNAIVIVLDATVNQISTAFEQMKEQISYALEIIDHEKPVMILLNKQDLKELNPLDKDSFLEKYGLIDKVPLYLNIRIFEISAKYGTNVEPSFDWLYSKID